MHRYALIFRHYLRRSFEPVGLAIMTGLPVAIIVIMSLVFSPNPAEVYYNGYNMAATKISTTMMIMFQFVGGNIILDYLYIDFRTDRRWRLLSAPCRLHVFVFSASGASIVFSALQGLAVVLICHFFLDVYWGQPWVLAVTILLVALIAQLLFMLVFLLTRKKSTAEGASQIVIWAMAILSGSIIPLPENALTEFLRRYASPFSLAINAIEQSGFMGDDQGTVALCLTQLAGFALLLGVAVILLGRRRSF